MALRGAQKAQGAALAGHRTGPAAHYGLNAGQPGRSALAPLAIVAGALPPALLALYRPVEGLRQGAAALAAPALPQRREPDQYHRGHYLFPPPALRRARAQVLLVLYYSPKTGQFSGAC